MTQILPIETKESPIAIVLVSNGPGEITTWVRPIAEKLHQEILIYPRSKTSLISLKLVLVPCPNSTGKEKEAAEKWNQFDKITDARKFWNLLIKPNNFENWPKKGLVIFLGGDQFWSVLLSARLGYKHMTYAEWIARWPQWNDRIAAMSSQVIKSIPRKYRDKCKVVGDLMADLNVNYKQKELLPKGKWVALMPGSKRAKLCVGVPFMLEVADRLKNEIPECNFLIPIAPTTSIEEIYELSGFKNPISKKYKSSIKSFNNPLKESIEKKFLTTINGTKIHIEENNPAHISLSQCDLAITTIGANTSELGALCVPMIVIVPTQHLNVMRAWDGFLGLIVRLPFISSFFNLLLSKWRLRKNSFLAWPNISAGRLIVPEIVGEIMPQTIAHLTARWLQSPERLKGQKEDLRSLRGKPGAVGLITKEIIDIIKEI